MGKENYVDKLKQNIKTSARKLKLDYKWFFQMDNDPEAYFESCDKMA